MRITAIIPSYARLESMERTAYGVRPLADEVRCLYQPRGEPLGAAHARRVLMEKAAPECDVILSLDDDCTFLPGHSIRWAAEHFEEDQTIAMVQLVNRRREPRNRRTLATHLYHCFLVRSSVVLSGFNYTPDEYLDDVELSIRVWLAGWSLVRTQRCSILHHVTKRGQLSDGGNEEAWQSGLVPIRTHIPEYIDAGLWHATESWRDGVRLPIMGSTFGPTKLGREIHHDRTRAIFG